MDITAIIVSILGSNGLVLFLLKRYFDRKDKREAEERATRERKDQEKRERVEKEMEKYQKLYDRIDTALVTIRLLSYARLSEEIENLLSKGYATPTERKFIGELFKNYKAHGWNGDMDSRLEKVYDLRTDPPHND